LTTPDVTARLPALYHFSEEASIEVFEPRLLPSRPELTTPLVWAIDEPHQHMYLFPRDCPRILLWPVEATTDADRERWFAHSAAKVIAYVEYAWLEHIAATRLFRYALPPETFTDLHDAGMWVSDRTVTPHRVDVIDDLLGALRAAEVELRLMDNLTSLYGLWHVTTLHWSGIRLHNARGWEAAHTRAARTDRPGSSDRVSAG
jgi:hypothetical protein